MKIDAQVIVCVHTYFVCCGAKNRNKFQRLSDTYISETTGTISFKLGMQGCVYGQTKIYKFDRNQLNSFRATIG